jgi:hypothetical protein
MYTLWKELVPPTAVEHVITAVLTSPQDPLPNLVLCRDSVLQIYSLQEKDELEIDEDNDGDDDEDNVQTRTINSVAEASVILLVV